ncbi:hypothetical protein [Coxiella-like endosymbiont of Rhipicephalus sanguineus]|uniref:hypothetical protein n=1 Tax=Coxiella-like endosymbiont of Rhipicephalus sanguineus TaxID=1955402 RepID=UPI0020405F56|nr:hypothetical protein [Coxiella-like endosymbiont of Rhipicephalus sanguineus]
MLLESFKGKRRPNAILLTVDYLTLFQDQETLSEEAQGVASQLQTLFALGPIPISLFSS